MKNEIKNVKKEYHQNKLKKDKEKKEETAERKEKEETFQEYNNEVDKYKMLKKSLPKKGTTCGHS